MNSRRGALLLRSCLLSTGDNQREVSSRDAFTIVFRCRSHATSIRRANQVNVDTARAVYTRVHLNFDHGESVLTSIESASRCTHLPPPGDGEMARWPLSNFYSPRHDPHGLVSPAVDIYAHPLRIVVTPTGSLSLIPDSPALDNRCHLRFRWHPKIVSAKCARIKMLRGYNRK